MIKKLKQYLNLSMVMSILFLILGVITLIYPKTTLSVFSYFIAVMSIGLGIYLIVLEFASRNSYFMIDTGLSGVLILVLGIVLLMYPKSLTVLIPICLGIWFIVSSVMKLRFTYLLKNISSGLFVSSIIMGILSIICGILFILNPLESSTVITLSCGILIVVYSISDIIEIFIFKRNMNRISKKIKEDMKIIDEI